MGVTKEKHTVGRASPVGTLASARACVLVAPPLTPFHDAKPAGITLNEVVPQFCDTGIESGDGFDWPAALIPFAVVWGFVKAIACWPRFLFAPRLGWYPFIVHLEIERRRFS